MNPTRSPPQEMKETANTSLVTPLLLLGDRFSLCMELVKGAESTKFTLDKIQAE